MKNKTTWIVVGVIAAIVLWGISCYNGMVQLEEGVDTAWGQVENQYQRRADLIPNLVSTVKGYATHESSTLEGVISARAKATSIQVDVNDAESLAQYQAAQGELSQALGRLMAVAEAYPELKANENFLQLQSQLEGTENRIATERMRYNETAKGYNVEIRVFPKNIIAGICGFKQKAYFQAEEGAKTAPKVEF